MTSKAQGPDWRCDAVEFAREWDVRYIFNIDAKHARLIGEALISWANHNDDEAGGSSKVGCHAVDGALVGVTFGDALL